MKKILPIIYLLIFSIFNAQSIALTQVINYASESNMNNIKKELTQKGFSLKNSIVEGYAMYTFEKKNGESIAITRNDELRMVIYKPSYSTYSDFKTKVLTKEFHFAYTYKNNEYYESSFMRIGINDKNGIISFFRPIKH